MNLSRGLGAALTSGVLLAATCYAGPEPILQDSKETALVPPPACNWTGFYIGGTAGGQFGHSEDKDLGDYNFPDRPWGYSESSFIGGGEIGYNHQWNWLVLGAEIDGGYMALNGRGIEPGIPHDTFGESDSDAFVTLRGRLGVALNCWLIYGTGGAIGVDYRTRVFDHTISQLGPDTIDLSKDDLDWGYTVGGGVERMFHSLGHRWSFKVEYLYFNLDSQSFTGVSGNGFGFFNWRAETEGHIVRAGLNFHF
jgi:outer membrane immunogenic protein